MKTSDLGFTLEIADWSKRMGLLMVTLTHEEFTRDEALKLIIGIFGNNKN